MSLYPLEAYLKKWSKDQSKFPSNFNYYDKYEEVKGWLCKAIFPFTDRVVAVEDGMFMTDHGEDHYYAVIDKCSELLQINPKTLKNSITPYEAFLLLMAALMHDAGMIHGRDEHGFSARKVASEMKVELSSNQFEAMNICKIAEAHQGKAVDGSDDTLSKINRRDKLGNQEFRASLLAAILKFSDEICETHERAAKFLQEIGAITEESQIHHEYAITIKSSNYNAEKKRVELIYILNDFDLHKQFKFNNENWYMYDWICKKLYKMDAERSYCMKFMSEVVSVYAVKAEVLVIDDLLLEQAHIHINIDESGYPEHNVENCTCGEYVGKTLLQEHGNDENRI